MADSDDNVTITAHWVEPQPDGTLLRHTIDVNAAPIEAMTGYDAIHDAIVFASE